MSFFSERLKALRIERDETQEYIAGLIGVTKASVCKYEKGETEPDMKSIRTIADHLDVTIDYMLGNTDIRTRPRRVSENIKLIMGDLNVDEFTADLRERTGLGLDAAEIEGYLIGKIAPNVEVLQALADYAGIYVTFFYNKNSAETLETERQQKIENGDDYPGLGKAAKIIKSKEFLALAVKIQENGLSIEEINGLIDAVINIKRNHKGST